VSSLWEQRAARNEALFREVNENIAGLEERHGSVEGPVFICECANPDCTEQLDVEAEIYQHVREQPRWFVLLPGHEDPQIERVVERHSGFLVVEKIGAAGQVAEQTDS
jgi:hypothetical protein